MVVAWSYGGGVQTAALAVLIREGALPRPDITVMADTGREATATWDYLRDVIAPYLAPVGVTVEIAPHTLATVDLYAHNGDLLVPAYTAKGRLPTFCSSEWKRDVVRRFLRQRGVESCDLWLGISWDERDRAKPSGKRWVNHVFPLLDRHMTRAGCLRLVEAAGLPPPPQVVLLDVPPPGRCPVAIAPRPLPGGLGQGVRPRRRGPRGRRAGRAVAAQVAGAAGDGAD